MKALKRLPPQRWAWVLVFVMLTAWIVVIAIFTPDATYAALQEPIVALWTGAALVGSLAALTGIFMSVSSHARTRVISVSVELFGILLSAIGPSTYGFAQFSLIFSDSVSQHIAPMLFAFFGLSILIVKLAVILPRFRREASDHRKEV